MVMDVVVSRDDAIANLFVAEFAPRFPQLDICEGGTTWRSSMKPNWPRGLQPIGFLVTPPTGRHLGCVRVLERRCVYFLAAGRNLGCASITALVFI